MNKKLPKKLLDRIAAVTNRRARFVLDRIAEQGCVSTAELQKAGYDHPPRAARDAVELGFALQRVKAKREDGQTIAAYVFDERELDPALAGRIALAKKDRERLINQLGGRCAICGAREHLQVDHRVPYAVAGESRGISTKTMQVLDAACNRKKSWECEHCANGCEVKNRKVCLACYWASPESYTHVAMRPERRLDIVWSGDEVASYDGFAANSGKRHEQVAQAIKAQIAGLTEKR